MDSDDEFVEYEIEVVDSVPSSVSLQSDSQSQSHKEKAGAEDLTPNANDENNEDKYRESQLINPESEGDLVPIEISEPVNEDANTIEENFTTTKSGKLPKEEEVDTSLIEEGQWEIYSSNELPTDGTEPAAFEGDQFRRQVQPTQVSADAANKEFKVNQRVDHSWNGSGVIEESDLAADGSATSKGVEMASGETTPMTTVDAANDHLSADKVNQIPLKDDASESEQVESATTTDHNDLTEMTPNSELDNEKSSLRAEGESNKVVISYELDAGDDDQSSSRPSDEGTTVATETPAAVIVVVGEESPNYNELAEAPESAALSPCSVNDEVSVATKWQPRSQSQDQAEAETAAPELEPPVNEPPVSDREECLESQATAVEEEARQAYESQQQQLEIAEPIEVEWRFVREPFLVEGVEFHLPAKAQLESKLEPNQTSELVERIGVERTESPTIAQETAQKAEESKRISISIEPARDEPGALTTTTHSTTPDMDDDLEWEFDNEPVFEKRQVEVKRNCDPRDEYELGDELGRGRFGTVFRCVQQSSGRKLAAKFVLTRRREDREDVEREVAIMSRLQHKRLLQLYDAFDNGQDEMCLITELVEGGELFERIIDDDFELTEKKAAIFMRQICEGIEYVHSQGIVHLDMKPENILCISKTGNRIKVIDFGLARQLQPGEQLHVMFGTPDFAAPEVLAYDMVSLATDMWSVGVICYVLLSGLSPFMGDNDTETMANVTRATYDFEDSSFEPISDLAKDFISRLLVREPSKRLKPSECLKHDWLQRGGVQLEAAVRRASIAMLASGGGLELATGALPQHLAPQLAAQFASGVGVGLGSPEQLMLLGANSPPASFSLDKRNLKKYVVRRKWHKTVHAIMALGRMGANLRLRMSA